MIPALVRGRGSARISGPDRGVGTRTAGALVAALGLVLPLVLALSACQQFMPDAAQPDDATGPDDAGVPDTVHVQVLGLPDDLEPALTLTGPAGFALELDQATSVSELPTGTYTLTVHDVTYGVTTFSADPAVIATHLEAGGSVTLTAGYAPDRDGARAALARLNAYRHAAAVPAATLDEEEMLPHWLHARYASKTDTTGHFEDPALPWYSEEGDWAARVSNLSYRWHWAVDGSTADIEYPHEGWIDAFADAPFHFFSLLDPRVTSIRSASFAVELPCDEVEWITAPYPDGCRAVRATGVVQAVHGDDPWPAGTTVLYPGPGQTVEIVSHGPERPDPLTACPGYARPVGLPLFVIEEPDGTWSDGAWRWNAPSIVRTRLTLEGEEVEHCAFDADTYANPDPAAEDLARSIMGGRGAVVLVPRHPLAPGRSYEVEVVTDRGAHAWTFHTADEAVVSRAARPLNGWGFVEMGGGSE